MPYIYDNRNGVGLYGNRVYGQGALLYVRPKSEELEGSYNITIKSVSGALIGSIRTDIERPIVSEISFEVGKNGSEKFSMKLAERSRFPILPYSIIQVYLGNQPLYIGIIDYQDNVATGEALTFTGYGLKNYLNELKVYDPNDPNRSIYTAGTDISDIVEDIARNWIMPYCPIGYNSLKIQKPSGVALYHDIEISKYPISKVLDIFSDMTNIRWFIDADGDFNFQDYENTKTLFLGFDFNKYKYTRDHRAVKNAIIVKRKKSRSQGGAGWIVGGVYADEDSIHKYGKRELTYQVPGYFSDDDCNTVGNALLEENKEPKPTAVLDNFKRLLKLENQKLRIINDLQQYEYFYSACDSNWQLDSNNIGDLTLSYDDDNYIEGKKSLKLEYQQAASDKVFFEKKIVGKIQSINYYVMSSIDITLRINIIAGTTTITQDFFVLSLNSFVNIFIDLSKENLFFIDRIEIEIINNKTEQVNINIDRIMLSVIGHRHDNLIINKIKYKFKPDTMSMSINAGTKPTNIENFLSGLFAQASELNFNSEEV